MSKINVSTITNRTGTSGPVLSGVTTATNGFHVTGGSVGIGTDNPSFKLDVRVTGPEAGLRVYNPDSSSNASGMLRLGNDTNSNSAFLMLNSSNNTTAVGGPDSLVLGHGLQKQVHLASGGLSRLTVNVGGNIGIGTTDPTRKLDVVDSGASGAVIRSQVSDNNGGYLAFEALNSSGTSVFSVSHNGRINLAEGINFENTGAGSSTTAAAHILDDYEEGTWVPTTTNFTHTTPGTATYTKIGRVVTVKGFVTRDQVSAPSSAFFAVSGFPFARSSTHNSIEGSFWLDNGGVTIDYVGGLSYFYATNEMIFAITTNPAQQAAVRYLDATHFSNGRGIHFWATYVVD